MNSKKILVVLLAVLLVLSCTALVACQGSTEPTGELQYALTEDGSSYVVVASAVGGDIAVPDSYNNLPVVGIADLAFSKSDITSVVIPDSVTYIGDSVFWQCGSLTSVTIGNSVATIGQYAFMDCTKLNTLTLGSSITSIGQLAFYGCDNLSKVYVVGGLDSWLSIDFANVSANPMYYTDNVYLDTVGASKLCDTTNVVVPSDTTAINSYAFYNCNSILSVDLAGSVVTIDDYAFDSIDTLATVSGTDSVTYIGDYAFNECTSLVSFDSADSLDYIGDYAFNNCKVLTSFDFGNSLTYLGERSFNWCKDLVSVALPGTVTDIGDYSFNCCTTLSHVSLAEGTETIGTGAFAYTKISTIDIPSSVYFLDDWCFSNCINITDIDTNCVEIIGSYAFSECTNIDTITFGASLASIGRSAFGGCGYNATDIYYNGSVSDWCMVTFATEASNPVYMGGTWYSLDTNGEYEALTELVIPEGITAINNIAFYGFDQLTSVTISDTVTTIGSYAFAYSNNIEFVTFGDSVQFIGSCAFTYCKSITEVILPDSMLTISNSAFANCTGITAVVFNDNLYSIGDWTFFGCSGLTNITLSSGVRSIGNMAFYECTNATSITLNEGLVSVGYRAFSWTAITELYIPSSVQSLGYSVADTCKKLSLITVGQDNNYFCAIDGNLYTYDQTQLLQYCIGRAEATFTLPSTVTTIDDRAFRYCTSLEQILVEDGSTSYCSVDGVLYTYDCTTLVRYPAGRTDTTYSILEGATTIVMYALESSQFKHITMPDTVTTLGYGCFESCTKLESIQLSNNLQYFGQYVFVYCAELKELTIPASVVSICDNVVASCSSLTSITFEDSSNWYLSQYNVFSEGVAIDLSNPLVNAQYITSDEYHSMSYCLYKVVE